MNRPGIAPRITLRALLSERTGRAAFSLLEVLIAMFILTVGMLGIAAVVVIGNASALRAMVADRVANVGRNVLADVRTREWLDATRWLNVDGSHVVPHRDAPLPIGEAFCIDPLYIAAVTSQPGGVPLDLGFFPYEKIVTYEDPLNPTNETIWNMRRVSVNVASNPSDPQPVLRNRRFWERLCVAEDDLVFDLTALSRPRLVFRTDAGKIMAIPTLPGETPAGNPLYPDYQGMYSWMVTVVPQVPGVPSVSQSYLVSAVIFRNRNLLWRDDSTADVPGERVAIATFLESGDLRLTVPNFGVVTHDPSEYLRIAEGQYLLLGGRAQPKVDPDRPRKIFLWYRVIAASEPTPKVPISEVTVAGPDWNPGWCLDIDGDGNSREAWAILCTNVYGVYTEVMGAEALSRWSWPVR